MRIITCINEGWSFQKEKDKELMVNLPHTWNAEDGQDGGGDYYRGSCRYQKQLGEIEVPEGGKAFLEFRGANSSAQVAVNDIVCGTHDGGYSTFRVDITEALGQENLVEVTADNSPNDRVYPQRADFTFYGGIYRDVYLVTVPKSHFDLEYYGAPGIMVTMEEGHSMEENHSMEELNGSDAKVTVKTFIKGDYDKVKVTVHGVGTVETGCTGQENEAVITIPGVHLWNGLEDPYLYQAKAELIVNGKIVDTVNASFGCRTYSFDQDNGFLLNGKPYPLHGVSRHQDRKGVGNALTKEMHKEDIDMILDMGANSMRLAHYQHDQYIYDLCDEKGIVVWAEVPYISEHMPSGRENTVSQMTELVAQNYNHPSIVCWALSNEISLTGITEDLVENHRILNDLVHKMDMSRVTAMANLFLLETDNSFVDIPDIMSYNLYYGWYVGEPEENDRFFDEFHKTYPDKIIGLSEYGADSVIKLQSPNPQKGDFSEQYQCIYHEHMLQMFSERPYLWSTYLWNMFEFGADGREEGDDPGINHKGVVTFDRKVKKDAFYIYKAWWSQEPFVHLCGRRYVDRAEDVTEIKVYSNQEKVALYVDGQLVEEKQGSHIFTWKTPIAGSHKIEARCSDSRLSDSMEICKVSSPNPEYKMESAAVKNWFEEPGMEVIPGYFSIQDKVGDIKKSPEGKVLLETMMAQMMAGIGDVAKNVEISESMQKMMDMSSMESMLKQAGGSIKPEMVIMLNKQLNKIKKP